MVVVWFFLCVFCDILTGRWKTTRKNWHIYEFTMLSGGLPYDCHPETKRFFSLKISVGIQQSVKGDLQPGDQLAVSFGDYRVLW